MKNLQNNGPLKTVVLQGSVYSKQWLFKLVVSQNSDYLKQ